MKILLTGASGYIGGHVYRYLLSKGIDIAILCRPQSNVDLVPGDRRFDFTGNYFELSSALESFRPDAILHLASSVLIEHQPADVKDLIEANITLPTLLLEAMVAWEVNHLITAGTSWQHFTGENEYRPANLYAATKQAVRDICMYYCDAYPLSVTELTLFDVYGPNDHRRKLMPLLVKLASGEISSLDMSPGDQLLDLVYVEDVAEAFLTATENSIACAAPGLSTYSVQTGISTSLKQLVAQVEKTVGARLPINFGGRPYRLREVMTAWNGGDPLPNWRARYDLTAGLKKVFEGIKV